jgi:CheY-like chemotaxis protein
VEALDFLHRQGRHPQAPRPDVVLLDLNLPKKNGHQVLAEIRADAALKDIPVVMLTISRAEEDILKAYNLDVNCYINKPIDIDQFTHVLTSIERLGMGFVERTRT